VRRKECGDGNEFGTGWNVLNVNRSETALICEGNQVLHRYCDAHNSSEDVRSHTRSLVTDLGTPVVTASLMVIDQSYYN
jgi:hypothetical protein